MKHKPNNPSPFAKWRLARPQRHAHMPVGINNSKGETIVEVLCAILVAGLASALLMSCFNLAHNMSQQARRADENLRKGITAAEEQGDAVAALKAKITYTGGKSIDETDPSSISVQMIKEITVYGYGGSNVYSYKK